MCLSKEQFSKQIPAEILRQNESMAAHTTLRVGGTADWFVTPRSDGEVQLVLQAAQQAQLPVLLLGNGSNLLVSDCGFRGVVLCMDALHAMHAVAGGVYAQAGVRLGALALFALQAEMTGLEFASGIPATVGGAVAMNAGAYGGEIAQVLRRAQVLLPNGCVQWLSNAELSFGYRHSRILHDGGIVLAAEFALQNGKGARIKETMDTLNRQRMQKQPLQYPSAGSFFKRPTGLFAGKLIDDAGLKGACVGGAQVSEKHAGFLINRGNATATDFLRLMAQIQKTVYARFDVWLEPEVRIVGETGEYTECNCYC